MTLSTAPQQHQPLAMIKRRGWALDWAQLFACKSLESLQASCIAWTGVADGP